MFDAIVVVQKCIEAVYQGAAAYHPTRIGTAAGRVIPKSDGSQTVRIKVNIQYPDGQEKFAPLDCVIDNRGTLTLKEHVD